MGFSLSRALAGAVVGGAHAAGDVFNDQLAEAAKDRARAADEERAFRVAEHADKLVADRARSARDYAEAKEKEKRKDYADTVKDQMVALKEKGISVGSAQGQFAIADAFLQKGQPEFANTFTDNGQKAQQADDNKELRKIQLANAAATAAIARQGKADAQEAKIERRKQDEYGRFEKLVLNDITKDFTVDVSDANNEGKYRSDRSAVPIARNYALDLYKQGVAPEEISAKLNQWQDIMFKEQGLDRGAGGDVLLERGQQRLLDTRKAAERSAQVDTQFSKGFTNKNSGLDVGFTGVEAPRFGLPEQPVNAQSSPQTGWTDSQGRVLPYKPAEQLNIITPGVNPRSGRTAR